MYTVLRDTGGRVYTCTCIKKQSHGEVKQASDSWTAVLLGLISIPCLGYHLALYTQGEP